MAELWHHNLLDHPHTVADKQQRVRQMFAAIAPSYDLNNRLHSLWMDQHWRRRAVQLAKLRPGDIALDVACGTGDLTIALAKGLIKAGKAFTAEGAEERRGLNAKTKAQGIDEQVASPSSVSNVGHSSLPYSPRYAASSAVDHSLSPGQVIGLDYTAEMLPIAQRKAAARHIANIAWLHGDAQALPLADASVDVVTIAFGIRNVADPRIAIAEFFRVLKPGGRLVILEFSLPGNGLLRWLYNFYFRRILPRTATWISGDRTGAYRYLPQSVNTFINREAMLQMMQSAGFAQVENYPLTCGICVAYRGVKV